MHYNSFFRDKIIPDLHQLFPNFNPIIFSAKCEEEIDYLCVTIYFRSNNLLFSFETYRNQFSETLDNFAMSLIISNEKISYTHFRDAYVERLLRSKKQNYETLLSNSWKSLFSAIKNT